MTGLVVVLDRNTQKVCVLGEGDAQDDLKQIRDMYIELVRFWDLDEDLIGEFDEKIGLMK